MKTMHAIATGCALVAGAVMIAAPATAQPGPGPRGDREFSLTYEQAKERWPNMTRERFDALDTDGDGVLTPADRIGRGPNAGPGRQGVQGPARPPAPNREFSLTYEQAKERWPNMTRERFDALDTDGDGVLTPADRIGRGPGQQARPRDGQGYRGDAQRPRDGQGYRGDGQRPRDGQGFRGDGQRPRDGQGYRGDGQRPRDGQGYRGDGQRPRDGQGYRGDGQRPRDGQGYRGDGQRPRGGQGYRGDGQRPRGGQGNRR